MLTTLLRQARETIYFSGIVAITIWGAIHTSRPCPVERSTLTGSPAAASPSSIEFSPLKLNGSHQLADPAVIATASTLPRVHRDDDEARSLIKRLGAREFVVREEATQALWELGPRVELELRQALRSSDRETVARAELILDRFRHGIYPDTPIEVVMLIEQFRTGDKSVRAQVIQQLVIQGEIGTVERLVDLSPTAEDRQEIADWILNRFDLTLSPLVLEGQFDALERVLLCVAHEDEDIAMCVGVLRHRDRLDEGIRIIEERLRSLEAEAEPRDTSREQRLLIAFHHALGDDRPALEFYSQRPDGLDRVRAYMISAQDWAAWSDWEFSQLENEPADPTWGLNRMEPLSYAALAHHLAGNVDRREQVLNEIRQFCEANNAALFFAAECFFSVDQPEEAIKLLTQRDASDGFSLLCQQHRYQEAFEAMGMEFTDDSIESWIESLLNAENLTTQEGMEQLYNGLDVCAQLALIGHTELAKRCYGRLAELTLTVDTPQPTLLREICRQEFLLGFDDLAWDQMERLFQTPRYANQEVLRNDFGARSLFPQDYVMSNFWWKALAVQETDTIKCLKRIQALLDTYAENDVVPGHFQQAMDSALAMIAHTSEEQRLRDYGMLADTCLRANLRELAKQYYEESFKLGDASSGIKIGDIYREAEDFTAAARWYERAYQKNPTYTWALHLQGVCLERTGNQQRGRQLKEQAFLLSLQPSRAMQLADALQLRDLSDDAISVWESVIASNPPLSNPQINCYERLGAALSDPSPARAADAWQQVAISLMSLSLNWPSRTVYLSTGERIHRMRAFAELDSGDVDAAWKEIELCQKFEPGSSEIPEYIVPRLEKAGANDRASELFDHYFQHYETLLELLPNSALHHNNLAWFSARCQRRLEDALSHARRAVEIEPTSSNYLDTLAEILFLKGNAQEAAELAKRCIKINPVKVHYREQLVRFENALPE